MTRKELPPELDFSGIGTFMASSPTQIAKARHAQKVEEASCVLRADHFSWKNRWIRLVLARLSPEAARRITGFCYPVLGAGESRMAIFSTGAQDEDRLRVIPGVYKVTEGWPIKGIGEANLDKKTYHKYYLWTNWRSPGYREYLRPAPEPRYDEQKPFVGTRKEYPDWCAEQRRRYGEGWSP